MTRLKVMAVVMLHTLHEMLLDVTAVTVKIQQTLVPTLMPAIIIQRLQQIVMVMRNVSIQTLGMIVMDV